MARLEIELVGINKDFKKVLKESKTELLNFGKALKFDDSGIKKVNTGLSKTKQLLKEISSLSAQVKSSLNSTVANTGISNQLAQDKLALSASKLEAQNYKTEIYRLAAELKKLQLATAQSRTQTVAAKGSYKEAQQVLSALGREIKNTSIGMDGQSPKLKAQIKQYRELNEKLKAFDAQLGNHQRNIGNYQKALAGIGSYLSSAFGFTALLAVGRKVVQNNAEISDSLSDVRRTAGLTAEEAERLSKALKTIDTRTSLKDLLGIATIGGQLGISKDQLQGFTQAIDQLAVALGGELQGGAEGIAKSLGVLDNVFDVTKSNAGDVNKAYNQIGSAILGLGQSGLATGDFLADFGERVGGLAKQAGLSVPIILSYGAVLQESGVSAEVAGTAFKRLLSSLASNSAGFLKVAQLANANLTLKEFNTIVNTDTRKALDLFFQGLQKGGSSTVAFNTILKSLKLSGGGVSQVISALSQNQEALNGHIQDATKDFNAGTLAAEQFALKNDNLAGSIDKLTNTFTNATSSGAISNFFKSIVDGANGALTELNKLANSTSIKSFFARLQGGFTGRGSALADLAEEENRLKKLTAVEIALENFRAKSREKQRQAILDQTIFRDKAYEQATGPASNKTLIANFNKEQKILEALRKEYKSYEAQIKKTPSNAATPSGFSKTKSVGGGKSTVDYGGRIADVAQNAEFSAAYEGLGDISAINEKTKQKYKKLADDLDGIQKQYTSKYKDELGKRTELDKKTAQARKTIETSLASELDSNNKDFEQKKADIIAGIEEKAGIVRETSRLKEQQQNDAYYNEQIRKYAGFADVIAALEVARLQQRNAINKQFDDELLAKSDELYSKIQNVQDKAFTENVSGTERGRARVREQLKNRLDDVQKYFDDLRKLYAANPLFVTGLNAAQVGVNQNLKAGATTASNPVANQQKEAIRGVVDSFGRDLSNTLRNLSNQADATFSGIFSTLSKGLIDSLNDVTFSQFSRKLSDALVNGTKLSLSGTEAASLGLGVAGGLISGSTKKTSAVGQGLGGALSGAGAGAALGSVVPGLGTVAGALIGGGLGLLSGIFGASKAKKEEQLQQQQLVEQKRQTALLERANALAYASQIVGRQTLNGLIQSVDINEFGQVITKVAGNDLLIIHDRTVANRKRGK